MTDLKIARRIGYQQAFKAITVGLIIAYVMMIVITQEPQWFFTSEYPITLIFTVLLLYGIGYLVGKNSGETIIILKYPAIIVGTLSGLAIFLPTIFVGSLAVAFQERTFQSFTAFYDYISAPIGLLSIWGFIPIIIIGIWYGWSIRRRGRYTQNIQVRKSVRSN